MAKKLRGAITSEDLLGKDVIDSTGFFLGVSDTLYINPKTMRIMGISVDKGFLQKGFIISINYIQELAKHAVFLNIQPATQLRGTMLVDRNGVNVGKVVRVELIEDTNDISAIFVRPGLFKKNIRIPIKYMKDVQRSTFLSITRDELHKKTQLLPKKTR